MKDVLSGTNEPKPIDSEVLDAVKPEGDAQKPPEAAPEKPAADAADKPATEAPAGDEKPKDA